MVKGLHYSIINRRKKYSPKQEKETGLKIMLYSFNWVLSNGLKGTCHL